MDDTELSQEEQRLMRRALSARAAGVPGFLQRLWGCQSSTSELGAEADFETGAHAGNRVGHVQGGLLAALASAASQAAIGDRFRLAAFHATPEVIR